MDLTDITLEMRIKGVELRWSTEFTEDGPMHSSAVVAKKHFSPGEIIEICPIMLLSVEDSKLIEGTNLRPACFQYGDQLAVAGGYGAVCHQSKNPNAVYALNPDHRALIILAKKEIRRADIISLNRPEYPNKAIEGDFRYESPWIAEGIVVRQSPGRGFGVYATRAFSEGEHVEICHLYSLSEQESEIASETELNSYMFPVGSKNQFCGWAIGYGCFYNHSFDPNIDPYDTLEDINIDHLAFVALRDIDAGEELVHDYTSGEPENIWFDVVPFKK